MRKYQKSAILAIAITFTIAFHGFFLPTLNEREKTYSPPELPEPPHPIRKISSLPRPSPSTSSSHPPKSPPLYQDIQRKLSRFHHRDTHIAIEKREILSPRKHRVLVTYTLPNGQRNSFLAIVDLKTQIFSRRWGRTIHENLGPPPLKLFPTGRL